MKSIFAALAVSALSFAANADFQIQDNVDRIVTIAEGQYAKCLGKLCKLASSYGDGRCDGLSEIGIAVVNLDSTGVQEAQELSCVVAVEEDLVAEPLPRLGTSN